MANWKSLPTEILHNIFNLLKPKELYSSTLVCKAWNKSAQSSLYSEVHIDTVDQLTKFYAIVERHSHLGVQVKKFTIYLYMLSIMQEANRNIVTVALFDLLPKLYSTYLPNLEEISDQTLDSYIPILNTLADSNLKHLKRLEPPDFDYEKTEVLNYTTCAMLLKDRLKNLSISNNFSYVNGNSVELFHLDHLYMNLNRFKKVKQLSIERQSEDEVEVLEHVLENCISLKEIKFKFIRTTQNTNDSMDKILQCIPRPNIKTLYGDLDTFNDKILFYMMQKLPELRKFVLFLKPNCPKLDHNILTQLLAYFSNIQIVRVFNLKIDQNNLTSTLGNYWQSTSNPGQQDVGIVYPENPAGIDDIKLELWKDLKTNRTSIAFSTSTDHNWKHIDFIEKNGKFIGELLFGYTTVDVTPHECDLPANFMAHTFSNCPHLRTLKLQRCALTRFPHTNMDMAKTSSIDELHFDECVLYPGLLEQLSLLLIDIKRFKIYDIDYRASEEQRNPAVELIMPHTRIETILFEDSAAESIYLKMLVLADRTYYYYRIETEDSKTIHISNEQEYNVKNEDRHVYICCQSKPEFKFETVG